MDTSDIKSLQQPKQISIQKIPPRRHRHTSFCNENTEFHSVREYGAVVPPEQVTYLHYMNSHQKKIQNILEETVKIKKDELAKFVYEADRLCYIDMLWKSLLSSKSSHIRRQQQLFAIQSGDILSDQNTTIKNTMEMEPLDFDALLRVIRMESINDEEPRIAELLADVNFNNLCRFLMQYYEGEKRCRYFDTGSRIYLIITNPSFLDSATMLCNNTNVHTSTSRSSGKNKTEMFFLFKNTEKSFAKAEQDSFSLNAIHKQFEDVISSICAYVWSDLLQNTPKL